MKEWFFWFIAKLIGCAMMWGCFGFCVVLMRIADGDGGDKTTWQEYFIVYLGLTIGTTLYGEICDLFERK
jgi:hypothetical protein